MAGESLISNWQNEVLKEAKIVISSLEQSVPTKLFQFVDGLVDSDIVDPVLISSLSEDEETWLQPPFDGIKSLDTKTLEEGLGEKLPKTNFILFKSQNNDSSLVSSIGKLANPYYTFVRSKKSNLESSKLTLLPNILDHSVIGDGVEQESDNSMSSSLLLDSHIAHIDKRGVLNFDDQTESECLQNYLNQTSSCQTIKEENQIISDEHESEPFRKPCIPPIMGRSYTKLPYQQVKYDVHLENNMNLNDYPDDLNSPFKSTPEKPTEFDSRTYRKSAIKSREKLLLSSERNSVPFSCLNNGNVPNLSGVAMKNTLLNLNLEKSKAPLNFDSSTFSRSQLKSKKSSAPFSGLQIKNATIFQSDSPNNFETFTIPSQNNGTMQIEDDNLENSLDFISNVEYPSLTQIDLELNRIPDSTKNGTITSEVLSPVEESIPAMKQNCLAELNTTFDKNQNISVSASNGTTTISNELDSTFEIAPNVSYLRQKASNLINRLSVSHDHGLEKLDSFSSQSIKSLSDSKTVGSKYLNKNSRPSNSVRRSLYLTNSPSQFYASKEQELNQSYSKPENCNKSAVNLRLTGLKSGLQRPNSTIEGYSEVGYYNLTNKKNVLNSTFCKSATNLSASYLVEKQNSVEDISRFSSGSSSSNSITLNSSYTCLASVNNSNDCLNSPSPRKKSDEPKISTPKTNRISKNIFHNLSKEEVFSPIETKPHFKNDQSNFRPFPPASPKKNQILDETVVINSDISAKGLSSDEAVVDSMLIQPVRAGHVTKILNETTNADSVTCVKPQKFSGLRLPSLRPPISRLPTAVSSSNIPRFASRLPTFRMRNPAPVKK